MVFFLMKYMYPIFRLRKIDLLSTGFIYMVSSSSTTGVKGGIDNEQTAYFERIKRMNLRSKKLVGFGISDKTSFEKAASFTNGAIIGSAFIKALSREGTIADRVGTFIGQII